MEIKVRFFARAKDLAGGDSAIVQIVGNETVRDLRRLLLQQHPGLEPVASMLLVALNSKYAGDDDVIPNGAEVAVFPPVSGG